jgi:vitamin B12 transporter
MFGKAVEFRHCPATVNAPIHGHLAAEASRQQRHWSAPLWEGGREARLVEAAFRRVGAQVRRPVPRACTARVPRGTEESMSLATRRLPRRALAALSLLALAPLALHAAEVHGRVTDILGAGVPGARLALIQNGKVVASTISAGDGSYIIRSPQSGRFFVLVAGPTFRQVSTQSFYAGLVQSHEENIVLEPAQVRQQVVVSATGTPTPEAQLGLNVTKIDQPDFRNRITLTDALRQTPGVFVVQQGMYGGITSLFVRGGDSAANRVALDGVPIEDIGGTFDYSDIAATGIENFEVYRGPNSVLWGADAESGVVNLQTARGSTPFPSLLYEGDAGNFHTYRNELQAAGTHRTLDYYGGFSAFRSSNALPQDEYHLNTEAANLGWSPTSDTTVRITGRNADAAVGLPGAYDFFGLTNDGKQSNQDTYMSATIENQTLENWHNLVRYGLTRKRQQTAQWYPAGIPITTVSFGYPSTNYYGNQVEIRGANGYSAIGQAVMNYAGVYPNASDSANNRDNLYFQTDYRFTPHIRALFGFRFDDERGAYHNASYAESYALERRNYDYIGEIDGDFRNRLFYSLSGDMENNQLLGIVGQPRIGLAYYPVRPGNGIARGTEIKFNFSKGIQEPDIFSQFDSLYGILAQNGEQGIAYAYNIQPVGGPQSRSYDGGLQQNFFSERLLLKANYFHNEFGNQIEFVGASNLAQLGVPAPVISVLNNTFGGADVNTLAYRAQGAEVELQSQVIGSLFLRGGYTYTDAVVQRSFSSSATAPLINPLFPNVPIGASSPLVGARPFRRPPHVGFAGITYTGTQLFLEATGSFASRIDDSTFLAYSTPAGDNTLLLPNRDLDASYARIDLGGSYQARSWLGIYAQLNNLTSDQHIGPIGYPSLPFTFRAGLRLAYGVGQHGRP